MTPQDLLLSAADLQCAVESAGTCTSATVESLKAFLLPEHPTAIQTKAPPAKKAIPQTSRATKSATGRPRKQALTNAPQQNDEPRSLQQKLALATVIVNTVLRSLTDAAKASALNESIRPNRRPAVKSPSSSNPRNTTLSRNQQALQAVSANRMSNSPTKTSGARRSSSEFPKNHTEGVRAQAQCARIAFAALRAHQSQEDSKQPLPSLQLEAGMSVLIQKLIALGLGDMALKELSILRNRLERVGSPASARPAPGKSNSADAIEAEKPQPRKSAIADLLVFRNTGITGQLLSLIVTTQLQVLKILAFGTDTCTLHSTVEHLGFDVSYSPTNMILRQIDPADPKSKDKAALQLENLAQLLQSLCVSPSSASDNTTSHQGSLAPQSALKLQLLVLEIRTRWWALTEHKENTSEELIKPFSRALDSFRRRCKLGKKEQYHIAKKAFETFAALFGRSTTLQGQRIPLVYQKLADLAQESSAYTDAIYWVEKALEETCCCEVSQSQRCSLQCQLAALRIRASTDYHNNTALIDSIRDAADSIIGELKGEFEDLDELLIRVASLRRTTFLVFQLGHKHLDNTEDRPSNDLISECRRTILIVVRFLIRYIGNRPTEGGNEKVLSRYYYRRKLVSQVANSAIDSVSSVAKASVKEEDWDIINQSLRDCIAIAQILEDLDPTESQNPHLTQASPFVSISSAYWMRYSSLKRVAADDKDVERCLQTSIDLIQHRTAEEKIAAFLLTRLEHYGLYLEKSGDWDKALQAYEDALLAHIELGVVARAAETAMTIPLLSVLDTDEALKLFGRTMLAYLRTSQRRNLGKKSLFFDTDKLSPSERGLILEYQFTCLISMVYSEGPLPTICKALHSVTDLLLSVYQITKFPIRRLNVVIQLLFMRTAHEVTVLDSVLFGVIDEYRQKHSISALGLDNRLQNYAPHLFASVDILLALRADIPNLKSIETTLASWSKTLQQYPDWKSIQSQVYNIAGWFLQLNLVVDYLGVYGLDLLKTSALQILVKLHEAAAAIDQLDLVSNLSKLGLHYAQLGYSGLAGFALQRAKRYLEASNAPSQLAITYHLSHAGYAMTSHNNSLCKESIQKVLSLLEKEAICGIAERANHHDRYQAYQLTAEIYFTRSTLATAEGRSYEALLLARLCVKTYYRLWAAIERRQVSIIPDSGSVVDDSSNESLATSMLGLSLSEQHSNARASPNIAIQSAAFWFLIPRLFQGLLHLSQCFAHNGLYPEANYYLEESEKIARTGGSSSFISRQMAIRAEYLLLRGDAEQAIMSLQAAEQRLSAVPQDRTYASLQIQLAHTYTVIGQLEAGRSASITAKNIIQQLMTRSFLDGIIYRSSTTQSLEVQMGNLSLQKDKPQRQIRTKKGIPKPQTKPPLQKERPQMSSAELPSIEVILLNQVKGEMGRERAAAALVEGALDMAIELLDEAASLPTTQQDAVLQALIRADLCQRRGVKRLLGDPVFSVVSESAISCPSTNQELSHHEEKSRSRSPQKTVRAPRIATGRQATKITQQRDNQANEDHARLLELAKRSITDVLKLSMRVSSTTVLHQVTGMLRKVLLILSALSSGLNDSVSSVLVVFVTELGRMLSVKKESLAIDVERQILQSREHKHIPLFDDLASRDDGYCTPIFDLRRFQSDYIDIIPQTWTVISIALSESFDEVSISKICARKTPFVLKIPLNRQDCMGDDEETFGFAEGKSELRKIVELANHSAQNTGDLSSNGAKTQWWDARKTLDARLKDLLNNMESIWLGGFRGILSRDAPNKDLLARFQQSLQNILDKYLPSRQRQGNKETRRVSLDSNVTELFTGLGIPDESNDIDEPLVDLLYFVVDILQFKRSERNAYDEIDFDSIVIETTDALRQFHQAATEDPQESSDRHTILILDKQLHCFPWESLKCLRGHSVSRLPSLACLRRRLLEQRAQQERRTSRQKEDRFYVDRHSGTFILNPGGDLTNTQKIFEEPLCELSSWDGIVQRPPDEAEMRNYLEKSNVFLYFGHGSGGQYIRPRTIKRLEKCAVALLMGCSSGALTEAGQFEPYGTPINYMHAGCPALLATLWDVTDKDIDRFSRTVLEKWGLFPPESPPVSRSPVKKTARAKGKAKIKVAEEIGSGGQESMALDSAVAQARDSCLLKYLNGAAPVIYGIPVFLS